jgi:hypothetical protein
MTDAAHLRYLSEIVHFCRGFDTPQILDVTPKGKGVHDPMYIVEARRAAA